VRNISLPVQYYRIDDCIIINNVRNFNTHWRRRASAYCNQDYYLLRRRRPSLPVVICFDLNIRVRIYKTTVCKGVAAQCHSFLSQPLFFVLPRSCIRARTSINRLALLFPPFSVCYCHR